MNKTIYGRILIVLLVLFSYQFYLLHHIPKLKFYKLPSSHYQYLAEGFRLGRLSLSVTPSAELLRLPDPYNSIYNVNLRLHDASLYNGKYYLYFGALPVLTFFMPIKLLTGYYPPESLAILFFLSISFIASFCLLIKIRAACFPSVSEAQLLFMGLLAGFANNALYLFGRPVFYEVAIASAFCCMNLALFFLFRFLQQCRARDMGLFSLFLALTVACRPNFALLCLVLIPAVFLYLCKYAPAEHRRSLISALLLPATLVACAIGTYNYLRFGSIFEFGIRYQLSVVTITAYWVFEIKRVLSHVLPYTFFYFLQPFTSKIYLVMPPFGTLYEYTSGILTTAPFVIAVLLLPFILRNCLKQRRNSLIVWFTLFLSCVPVINLLSLYIIPSVAQRYEIDFVPYFILLSIISLWLLEGYLSNPRMKFITTIFTLMGSVSILTCLYIGL